MLVSDFEIIITKPFPAALMLSPFGFYGDILELAYTNDRIATQRYLTSEIPIGSRVMSRTTSAPTGGRARKVVAIIAGCRSFRTFRDCHASIACTTVGAQPNLTRMFGQIWDRFEPKKIGPTRPRGVPGGV